MRKEEFKDGNDIDLITLKILVRDLYTGQNRSNGHESLANLLFGKMEGIPVGVVKKWFLEFENLKELPNMKIYNGYINKYKSNLEKKDDFKSVEKNGKFDPDFSTVKEIEKCIDFAKKTYASHPKRYLKARELVLKEMPQISLGFEDEFNESVNDTEHEIDKLFKTRKRKGLFMVGQFMMEKIQEAQDARR